MVFYPGSCPKAMSETSCLQRIAEGIKSAMSDITDVMPVIENTAGHKNDLGYSLEQISKIIKYTNISNIGVCIDTAHAFQSIYDITNSTNYQNFWDTFNNLIGMANLAGLHINDSKVFYNSFIDNSANIGKGAMGLDCFSYIMNDKNIDNIPLILETPDSSLWKSEIQMFQQMVKK